MMELRRSFLEEAEDWRDWRLSHAGLTWRAALPEDSQAIDDVIDATEQHTGVDQDRPSPFGFPVILTIVAENEDGMIVDAILIELAADIRKLGLNRQAFDAMPILLPVLGGFLAQRKVRIAHMSMPCRWKRLMAAMFRKVGFESDDGERSHWFRRV